MRFRVLKGKGNMIKQEKNYEFRKRFMQMHKKNLRDWNAQIKNDEIDED